MSRTKQHPTQHFVRYRAEVERGDPTFEQTLQTLIATTKQYVADSVAEEGIGQAVRDAHAKAYGLARAELEILDGLPTPYAQGIYATPGRHEALIRFSSGSAHTGPDAQLGNAAGIGLKLFGITGPTLLEDEPDSGTFDYAMINAPIFFVNSAQHYISLQHVFLQLGKAPPPNHTPAAAKARFHHVLYDFLTGLGTLPPEEWYWDEFLALVSFVHYIKPVNLLLSTYWTMAAVRHGAYIAKVRVAPVRAFADQVVRHSLDSSSAPEVFRPALVAELQERPYEFDVQVQLCTDLDRMPVEEPTVEWPEALSPFVTVAKLRLPQQNINGQENLRQADAVSFTPWRSTEEHRPLGSIMRARKEVYRQSSLLRHQLNHQVRKEPKNLAEVFGAQVR